MRIPLLARVPGLTAGVVLGLIAVGCADASDSPAPDPSPASSPDASPAPRDGAPRSPALPPGSPPVDAGFAATVDANQDLSSSPALDVAVRDRPVPDPDAPSDSAAPAPPPAPAPVFAAAAVFDTQVLHRIDIQVEPQHLATLDSDTEERVPCTIVFDGTTLAGSGIRRKGGNGSRRPLADKPPFSIKFNQFIKGQKLLGLSKLLLNNAIQDPSFLSEHMAYELSRRAGSAAPLTAHGLVTFNGQPKGLYVVREAVNDDFLRRSYGKANEDGNLYEGGEFVRSPESPELKDEKEEMRSRDDLREMSGLIRTTADAEWVRLVGAKLDIASFLAGWAVEGLVDHWDGYFFGPHNYFVYNHPGSGRFVFIVAGMDSVFGRVRDPRLDPKTQLASKLLQFPETRAQLQDQMTVLLRTLDLAELLARVDQAARAIRSHTPSDPRTAADFQSFEAKLAGVKANMARIKNYRVPVF
jgi:spore coat protein H